MSEYIAHTENDSGLPQALEAHLRAVADKASGFAAAFDASEEGHAAGLLHDIGKFKDEFQSYLKKRRKRGIETHHAAYGAAVAFEKGWPSSFAIAGHHAGLHDRGDLQSLIDETGPYNMSKELPIIKERFQRVVGGVPEQVRDPAFLTQEDCSPCTWEFYTRMLFSCLVDADFLDTEEHFSGRARHTIHLQDVCEGLMQRLESERQSKPRDGMLNETRNSIFNQCVRAAGEPKGFYSLTVPTGGGKTLSSMAFALAHAHRWNLDRIIVVIPYLSIIEQNAAEYRRILDPQNTGVVIEHHSGVPVPEDWERAQSSVAQRAAENWDAPLIVTTSVQFVESLFASSPSKCRKLHNISRSVVVMDEVQTLPFHLLEPLLSVLRELRNHYGVTFLFLTATQPGFRHDGFHLREGFKPGEVREITHRTETLFRKLQRVKFQVLNTMSWTDLSCRMAACGQVLAVVNVRRHAFALWEALRSALPAEKHDSLFHLSSAMCPEHRLWTLGEIKNPREGSIRGRLARGFPCRVVATQVVEAGVDFDFPVVFRAMGPLDSIIQAAGRCNREGRLLDEAGRPSLGEVYIFTPQDHVLPPGLYKTATQQTAVFLAGLQSLDVLCRNPALFGEYFSQVVQLTDTDHARGKEGSIQDDRSEFRFRSVSRKARMIEDEGVPVAVHYGMGSEIISRIRSRAEAGDRQAFTYRDLRTLQRFMVNLRRPDLDRAQRIGLVTRILPDANLFVVEEGCYNRHLGLLIEQRPTEDFIV
ncbi:MAG: CRISPR-associated helicase Cas3' [Thermodesulfobacteriota bacterium]